MKLRPEVRAFAQLMETKLRANEHKGGWKDEYSDDLLRSLEEELDELRYVLEHSPHRSAKIAKEAADVANFAMMIADVVGGLPEGKGGT